MPLLLAAVLAMPLSASAAAPALPDTASGRLAGQLLHRLDSPADGPIRPWANALLSPAIAQDERDAFLTELVVATRDSGGLDVVDVRSDPRQPDLLQLALKARRGGTRGLLVLSADAKQPDRIGQASLFPMDDPALYAGWPKDKVPHERIAEVARAALDKLADGADFSGCLTIRSASETILDECRGVAERSFGVPVDRQTRFHIASLGKMFTAVAIAQLVEAGKLSWDATLAQQVPEYADREAAGRITVWQLLHHTAGLGDFMVAEYFQNREKFIDPADYLDLIARQPKSGEPGKAWNYSNAGYVLLGRIVEKVSRESYFDYVQRHVFAPAGMTASGFDRLDEVVPKLAVGYYHQGIFAPEWKAAWLKLGAKASPAGGGYSNNADLLRFAQALREGKLLKPSTVTRMFDDAVPAGPGAYAAGFGDRLSHGAHVRGHAGGIEGTTANLQMVWESGAAVALTSNQGQSQNWMLAERIADLLAAEAAAH
jgi:CubicO group peptidase (beta-lactamase class C family)